jgi:hypothetical protein
MNKLDIHDIANLTRYAVRKGYVNAGEDEPSASRTALFERIRQTENRYHDAMKQYTQFLHDRESIGLANPDSSTGARRLRLAEEAAHREYHAALIALKDFLLRE